MSVEYICLSAPYGSLFLQGELKANSFLVRHPAAESLRLNQSRYGYGFWTKGMNELSHYTGLSLLNLRMSRIGVIGSPRLD
jgi:hypothetical protein